MTNRVPEAYDGREQAFVKHQLLESYLRKLFLIVGMGAGRSHPPELCYVDCFAGPWGDDSESIESTSIAISLRILDECRKTLAEHGINARVRALYIEKDPRAFERLAAYLARATPVGMSAEAWHGDFVDLRGEILKWPAQKAFAFFFIDPKGWKEIGIGTLRPLLQRPLSEFLINFMYDFINRTMSMPEWQHEMEALLGAPVSLEGLGKRERESRILKTYRQNLKDSVPMPQGKRAFRPRTAYVRILDRTKERPKYHLVYLTSHARGLIEFMLISEEVDLVQKRVRAATRFAAKERATGMADLFGVASPVDEDAGHASEEEVDAFWLRYLEAGQRRVGEPEFSEILEQTDWFPGDLQASLVRLIGAGKIFNHDASGHRPRKPLHFDTKGGERLELREGNHSGTST